MSLLRQIIIIVGLAGIASALSWAWHPSLPDFDDGRMPVEEALRLGDNVLWLDARAWEFYEAEHVPGAIWLSRDDWDAGIDSFMSAWSPGQSVVVYCDRSCSESAAVADMLIKDYGIENVHVLKGGWEAWKNEQQ